MTARNLLISFGLAAASLMATTASAQAYQYQRYGQAVQYDRQNIPGDMVGTFRGLDPSSRRPVNVTIEPDGDVRVVYDDGTQLNGRYDGRDVDFRENVRPWVITRTNSGDLALTVNGRSAWLERTNDNGYGYDQNRGRDFGRNGNYGYGVPLWAVGTFRARNSDHLADMTINPDGSVVFRNDRTGQIFHGAYNNGVVHLDWGDFYVSQNGSGVQVRDVNNSGNDLFYRRVGR
jgi:hypothetical protein